MNSNPAETEDILKAIREMMGEDSTNESLPKDVLDLTEKAETITQPIDVADAKVDNGILELTNIINDKQEKVTKDISTTSEVNIDNEQLETIVKEKIRSEYSSKIDEIIKNEIENIISEKLSAIRVDFKNNQSR